MNAKPVIGDFIACALRLLLSVLLVSTCMSGTTFGLSLVGGARILAETSKGPSGGKTRVVMIGGSFAGTHYVCSKLQSQDARKQDVRLRKLRLS